MYLYVYDGPVRAFGHLVSERWHGETMASSEKKAVSNLKYQFRLHMGYSSTVPITFTGKIT